MRLSVSSFVTVSLPMMTTALLASRSSTMTKSPGLDGLISAQTDQQVMINLDIGQEGDTSRFAVKGMTLNLKSCVPDYQAVAMPGINGPHPNLSTGHRALEILQEGEFVSMKGTQTVKTLNGSWELVWKKTDQPRREADCR